MYGYMYIIITLDPIVWYYMHMVNWGWQGTIPSIFVLGYASCMHHSLAKSFIHSFGICVHTHKPFQAQLHTLMHQYQQLASTCSEVSREREKARAEAALLREELHRYTDYLHHLHLLCEQEWAHLEYTIIMYGWILLFACSVLIFHRPAHMHDVICVFAPAQPICEAFI